MVAAIDCKSQVGSFANNFNNRTEEAIGSAHVRPPSPVLPEETRTRIAAILKSWGLPPES